MVDGGGQFSGSKLWKGNEGSEGEKGKRLAEVSESRHRQTAVREGEKEWKEEAETMS